MEVGTGRSGLVCVHLGRYVDRKRAMRAGRPGPLKREMHGTRHGRILGELEEREGEIDNLKVKREMTDNQKSERNMCRPVD